MWDDLLEAISDKDQDKVIQIINNTDKDGITLLHRAVSVSNEGIVNKLLEAGANPNVVDKDGTTPLHHAAGISNQETLTMFLEAPDTTGNYGMTVLHRAAGIGYQQIIKTLLEAGANPNTTDKDGRTPLHCAIVVKRQEIVKTLLELQAGANPNTTDEYGRMLLHRAAGISNQEIVETLLEAGANPNAVGKYRKTALDVIAERIKDLEIIELSKDAAAIHKIIEHPASAKQVEIKNLDLLRPTLSHNFQLHNQAYKSKAKLKHVFDHIKPINQEQTAQLKQIKIQFNKIIEDGIDYADQSNVLNLQYLVAANPLVETLKIISAEKDSEQKAQKLVDILYSQAFNVAAYSRSYITQVFKLNFKMIKKIAQTHPKVAKDLFNIATCTDEQREQYRAKIEEAGVDIEEGIDIANSEHLKSENDIQNNSDVFSLFPQFNILEVSLNGQTNCFVADHSWI